MNNGARSPFRPGDTGCPAAEDWLLTPQRVAVHLPSGTAVVADLHLGYERARQRAGEAVPAGDLNGTLSELRTVLVRQRIHRLVVAGDLFEEGRYSREISAALLQWFADIGVELVGVVPGNHDGGMEEMIHYRRSEVRLGPWRVVHGDGRLPRGRVVHGHFHPCLRWGNATAPCYLVGERRLMLPAYSADAAGVNVLDKSAWRTYRCYAIAGEEVLDFGQVATLAASRRTRNRKRKSRCPYQ